MAFGNSRSKRAFFNARVLTAPQKACYTMPDRIGREIKVSRMTAGTVSLYAQKCALARHPRAGGGIARGGRPAQYGPSGQQTPPGIYRRIACCYYQHRIHECGLNIVRVGDILSRSKSRTNRQRIKRSIADLKYERKGLLITRTISFGIMAEPTVIIVTLGLIPKQVRR